MKTFLQDCTPFTSRLITRGLFVIALLFLGTIASNPARAQDEPKKDDAQQTAEPTVDMKQVSYVIGINIGRNLRNAKIQLDSQSFNEGLQHALEDKEIAITDEQMGEILDAFAAYQGAQEAKAKLQFLADNKAKEGVKTTESGLQYRVIKSGEASGAKPKATDTVTVHYNGTLIDGTVFDSSVERGEPAVFGVTQVIPGWTEALQLMREGDKWEIVLPSELAYGKRGAGQIIGPDEVLIFEVELIKVGADAPKAE
jgi:FKBP-type peptidyl-prolyl cis-trans isomerase